MSQPVQMLEFVIGNLAENEEDIRIAEIPGQEESVIEVRVHEDDIGKVIGKSGSVARALRTLVSAVGMKEQKSYSMEIID